MIETCTDVQTVSRDFVCKLLTLLALVGGDKKVGAGPGFEPTFVSFFYNSFEIGTFLIKALLDRCCSLYCSSAYLSRVVVMGGVI